MNLAELIRAARMDQKLSQKALGKLISTAAKPNGVWSTYIGQIEKGDKIPSDDVCVELARILDLERDLVLETHVVAKDHCIEVEPKPDAVPYLRTKRDKMGHLLTKI